VSNATAEKVDRQPLLSVHNLVKTFGAVRAVDGVSLDIYPKEVVGIIGDNGAGKSTFLSLLAGFHQADSGEFLYRGKPVTITSPRTARHRLSIEMVYQNLELAPDLAAWENLFLGEELKVLRIFADRRRMVRRAGEVLEELNTKIKPTDLVAELSGGEKQTVAIGRTLLFDRDVVIMDEPTAAISIHKVQELLELIQRLKSYGKTILLVSHRLEDVLAVSDRIVVFYHGTIRKIMKNEGLSVSDLVHEMF
jgi:ABC-type sugar transport system ATPase subunit